MVIIYTALLVTVRREENGGDCETGSKGLFDKWFRQKHGFALSRDKTSNYFIFSTFSYF
jgi:hypothetical protein